MAKKVPAKREKMGMYDSATGKSLFVLKTVNITKNCPAVKKGKVVLKFTKAQRGRIAQIDDGSMIHFFVEELDAEMRAAPRDDTFGSTAERLGLDKTQLRSIIEQHAPAA